MPIDWNYNMTISEVIDALESRCLILINRQQFSKQEYNDLILSYHIQKLIENNNIQSTTQTNNKGQQTSVTTLSQQIQAQIDASNKLLDNQFEQTQSMFLQIEQQNIPQLNESVNQAVIQSQSPMNLIQDQFYQPNKQLECTEISDNCLAKQCGTQELESEFIILQICINEYQQKFKELTDKFKQQKEKFEIEKKKAQSNQQQLLSNIKKILENVQ